MSKELERYDARHPEAVPVVQDNEASKMLMAAIQGKLDPALIERLMDLRDRDEASMGKRAYHAAMANFKADPPKINKDQTVEYSGTKYNHASLANVTEKINIELSKHGLSVGWKTEQTEKIKVTCTITHVLGHSESTSLSADPDKSGSKNAIQAIGSTISYLERYTILALTGLATHDQDDDGNSAGFEFITPEQVEKINNLIKEVNPNEEKFFKIAGAETVDTILSGNFGKAMGALLAVKKKRAEKKREPGE